jgi:arsenate reductase
MEKHPTVGEDIEKAVETILRPFSGRKKVLFASRRDACAGPMASAFASYLCGSSIEALCGGTEPSDALDPLVMDAMVEEGMDLAFHRPVSLETALDEIEPDLVVKMGDGVDITGVSADNVVTWPVSDTAMETMEDMRRARDRIKNLVKELT